MWGGGGGICSNGDNGIERSFHRQTSFRRLKFSSSSSSKE